jgi:hypothetical protein
VGRDHRIALLIVVGLLPACRKPRPSTETAPPVASIPADRLAPGEAAPGQEKAFDLVLPRGGKIDRVFGNTVYAFVALPPETVASYIRAQADEAMAVVGPTGTVIPKLHVRGAGPGYWLRVEITGGPRPDETLLVVDRVEDNKPMPSATTNEELMKEVGLTPDGKLLNPKRVE